MDVESLRDLLADCDASFPVYCRTSDEQREVTELSPLLIKNAGGYEFAYVLLAKGEASYVDEQSAEEQRVLDRLDQLGYN